jgi:hypothetical protein
LVIDEVFDNPFDLWVDGNVGPSFSAVNTPIIDKKRKNPLMACAAFGIIAWALG